MGFGDALSDDGNGVNLEVIGKKWLSSEAFVNIVSFQMVKNCIYLWVLHGLHGAVKGGTQRRKADEHVHIWVLLHGVTHVLVHRDEDLFMAPVELLLVVSTGRTAR